MMVVSMSQQLLSMIVALWSKSFKHRVIIYGVARASVIGQNEWTSLINHRSGQFENVRALKTPE